MANERLTEQFAAIERKIERLSEICRSHEAEKRQYREKIEQLEAELQKRLDIERAFAEEKNLIRSKIENLLARLEDIEEPQ
ncbi:MAG: hypothetical protein AB1547_02650 [Thermodesulfobacteriota bacterium]